MVDDVRMPSACRKPSALKIELKTKVKSSLIII